MDGGLAGFGSSVTDPRCPPVRLYAAWLPSPSDNCGSQFSLCSPYCRMAIRSHSSRSVSLGSSSSLTEEAVRACRRRKSYGLLATPRTALLGGHFAAVRRQRPDDEHVEGDDQ